MKANTIIKCGWPRIFPFFYLLVALFCLQNSADAAVAFGASGAVATGTTSLSVPHPAGIAAGDLLVLAVGNKYPTNGPSTPAGWTLVANGQQSGGLGAAGADSGQVYVTIFVKQAVGTETGNLTVTLTAANASMARMFRYTKAAGTSWFFAATNGTDNTAGTDWSVTGAADPGIAVGDVVIVGSAVNGNRMNSVPPWSAHSVAATGATFGAANARQGSSSGTGHDVALVVSDHPVTAGTASAVPVYTMTGSPASRVTTNSPTGASVFLRIRESTTTLATGSDPAAATVAPGAAATDVNQFTLQTNGGTETVSSVTVNLSTLNGVGLLAITDSTNTVLGSTASPVIGANTITVTGMSATTTLATFKVRVTPLSHAAMPAPPGAAYAITAPVTAWVGGGTHTHTGTDTNLNALTIDNLSPLGATAVSGTGGDAQVTLNWTTSATADFSRSVMLRWTGASAGAEVPAEGVDYLVGNLIATATVVCVRTTDGIATAVSGVDGAGTGGCSATALSNAQAYTYRIFQKDANGNYDTGVTIGTLTPVSSVGGFNAYETTTAAGALTGVIKTKAAGTSFNLALIALNSTKTAIATTFTGTVKVELLNSSSGGALDANGCNAGWTVIQTLASSPAFVVADNGRKTVAFQENNAWANVRVRISFPATGTPTAIGCSNDNFAIRPNAFANVSVSDQDWLTAGVTRSLYNTSATGGNVHKAGRPFTLIATAVNGLGTPGTTTNYTGTPSAVLATCGGTGCTTAFGTFSIGSAAVAGVINSPTASYSEVGALNLQLQDQTFAAVDAADSTGDCTATGRYICSASFNIGRFVPDRFVLATSSTPLFKTFNDTACASRSFTYVGQPFGYVTAPQSLVTAQNAAGGTTANYRGSLWKISTSDLTQTYSYTLTPLSTPGLDVSLIGVPTMADNNNGTGTATANSTGVVMFTRNTTTPLAPFTAAIDLSMSVIDGSENGVAGNGIISTSTPALFSNIAFDSGNAFRYGRLRLLNAHGSELLDLPVATQTQYWNGTVFATNASDNCTTLQAVNIALVKTPPACTTTVSGNVSFTSGIGNLKLLKPNTKCAADMTVGLAAENKTYLQGRWSGATYTQNPSARATFGIYKGNPLIYQRENY